MFNRRSVMSGLTAVVLAPQAALAVKVKTNLYSTPNSCRNFVDFPSAYANGSVIVDPTIASCTLSKQRE